MQREAELEAQRRAVAAAREHKKAAAARRSHEVASAVRGRVAERHRDIVGNVCSARVEGPGSGARKRMVDRVGQGEVGCPSVA